MYCRPVDSIKEDGWVFDMRLYVLSNNISVISGRWTGNDEILCAMEPRLQLKKSLPQVGLKHGTATQQARAQAPQIRLILIYFSYLPTKTYDVLPRRL